MILLLCVISLSFCTLGVDFSTALSVSTLQCLHNQGYTFAIPRGYCSYGAIDPNVNSNIANAKAAGFAYVDAYIFPCVSCGNAAGQIDTFVNSVHGYGMAWYDVEIYKWSSSQEANREFILAGTNQLKAKGVKPGIYTSLYNWETICGKTWSGVSSLALWYAHYDNNPSFSDFSSYGGWSKPSIKQYAGDKTVCGAGVDLNFY